MVVMKKLRIERESVLAPPQADYDRQRWAVAADYCEEHGDAEGAARWRTLVRFASEFQVVLTEVLNGGTDWSRYYVLTTREGSVAFNCGGRSVTITVCFSADEDLPGEHPHGRFRWLSYQVNFRKPPGSWRHRPVDYIQYKCDQVAVWCDENAQGGCAALKLERSLV